MRYVVMEVRNPEKGRSQGLEYHGWGVEDEWFGGAKDRRELEFMKLEWGVWKKMVRKEAEGQRRAGLEAPWR